MGLIKNIVSKVKQSYQKNKSIDSRPLITKFLNPIQNKKVNSFTVPVSFGGGISKGASTAGSVIKSGFNYLKTFTTRKTINPAAGVTGASNILKTLGKTTAAGATVGTIFQGGRLLSKYGVSGDKPSVSDVRSALTKGAVTGAGLGLSPVGGIVGGLQGGGIATAQQAKAQIQKLFGFGQSRIEDATNVFKSAKDIMPTIPNLQTPTINNYFPQGTMQDLIPQVSTQPVNVILTQPETPRGGFDTSFSVGGGLGGGSEILPLLLLAAGGIGFAGYKLGKRSKKRKKKKYKKKRKH